MTDTQPIGNFNEGLNTKVSNLNDDVNNLLNWIKNIVGIQHELLDELKDGVTLCKLLNFIEPGTIESIYENQNRLEERENIQNYLDGCVLLGMDSGSLFRIDDLESMVYQGVVENVQALDRLCQQKHLQFPILGQTIEHGSKIKETEEKIKETIDIEDFERNLTLEEEKKQRLICDLDRTLTRSHSRELIRRNTLSESDLSSRSPAKNIRRSPSPDRNGLDKKSHEKLRKKIDPLLEERAMNWIEEVTNERVNDLYTSLMDGILLCRTVNAIRPGLIPANIYYENSHNSNHHQINIECFIVGCQRLGITDKDLFEKSDLYKRTDMNAVINTIHKLASIAQVLNPDLITMEQTIAIYEEGVDRYGILSKQIENISTTISHMTTISNTSETEINQLKYLLEKSKSDNISQAKILDQKIIALNNENIQLKNELSKQVMDKKFDLRLLLFIILCSGVLYFTWTMNIKEIFKRDNLNQTIETESIENEPTQPIELPIIESNNTLVQSSRKSFLGAIYQWLSSFLSNLFKLQTPTFSKI